MTEDVSIKVGNGAFKYASYWGVNFADGAVSALLTPVPMKEFIEVKSRLIHGKSLITSHPKFDSRELSLPFNMIAKDKQEFFTNYDAFCTDVLSHGAFDLKTDYIPNKVFHLVYLSCTQFGQFDQRLAQFVLKVIEPNPSDRNVNT